MRYNTRYCTDESARTSFAYLYFMSLLPWRLSILTLDAHLSERRSKIWRKQAPARGAAWSQAQKTKTASSDVMSGEWTVVRCVLSSIVCFSVKVFTRGGAATALNKLQNCSNRRRPKISVAKCGILFQLAGPPPFTQKRQKMIFWIFQVSHFIKKKSFLFVLGGQLPIGNQYILIRPILTNFFWNWVWSMRALMAPTLRGFEV